MRTRTEKRAALLRGIVAIIAQARDEAESAARSGALALEFWQQERSTPTLVSVQLSDARDEFIKAYKGIAELNTKDSVTSTASGSSPT